MSKELDEAIQDIRYALMSFCEECSESEGDEIDRAWDTILTALREER